MRLAAILLAAAQLLSADWTTPNGKRYHPRRDCIALARTKAPTEISQAEAERRGLKLCGICSHWKTPVKKAAQ